jgi:hypothetical protein
MLKCCKRALHCIVKLTMIKVIVRGLCQRSLWSADKAEWPLHVLAGDAGMENSTPSRAGEITWPFRLMV